VNLVKQALIILALSLSLVTGALVAVGCGTSGPATSATTAASTGSSTTAGSTSATAAATSDGITDAAGSYQATNTSYTSATKTITIKKVTTGTGDDTITYYVADVQLSDSLNLRSAFSSGTYGGKTEDTSAVAEANNAVVAINGDFYSSRSDGIMIRNGVIYRDVPTRQGLAINKDGTMKAYDETTTTAEQLLADGVWNTYSFGPGLLTDGQVASGLDTYEPVANERHPIQGTNPRTGIGIIEANHFVFVVVDGRSPGYSRGVTLAEFAQIFQSLGCSTAYNLDGGGSSTLYFMGNVVNQPAQQSGQRAISDILYVN
jgi:exopolysaccharide biosynthesis protein